MQRISAYCLPVITNGHPGATDALMNMVFEPSVSAFVTVKSIGEILKVDYKVLSALSTHPVQKSFPDREDIDNGELVKGFLCQIRYSGEKADVFVNKRSPVYRYQLQFSQVLQEMLLVKANWMDGFDHGIFAISILEIGWGIKLVGPDKANASDIPVPDINDPSLKETLVLAF